MNIGEIDVNYAFRRATSLKKSEVDGLSFDDYLQEANETKLESYVKRLKSKYGNLRIESVPNDKDAIDKVSKTMRGNDVIIAPNILEQMANDPEKAAYYENKIDYFFNTVVPRDTALCASKGLVYDYEGVIVHDDGTVTYICGCSDSPERVAKVNAINKAKQEKRAAAMRLQEDIAMRRAMIELSRISDSGASAQAIAPLPNGVNCYTPYIGFFDIMNI